MNNKKIKRLFILVNVFNYLVFTVGIFMFCYNGMLGKTNHAAFWFGFALWNAYWAAKTTLTIR